ncbi:MAG: hypothetical protein M3Q40_09735 [Pseudomonadota bacterium]|nr:hypothetical protein [Pseudomonadota bacterium]
MIDRNAAAGAAQPEKTAPPAADPSPGENAGYAEDEPRDREDAQIEGPGRRPNPDAGGLDREIDNDPDPAAGD